MEYNVYNMGNYHIIEFQEVLHLTSVVTDLQILVTDLLKKGIKSIAFQFINGSYLCSHTGATIIQCWEAIKDENGVLALININNDILDFLKIIDFEKMIEIYKTPEELKNNESSCV